eukprot:755399-Hanusia_phi.AAC.2
MRRSEDEEEEQWRRFVPEVIESLRSDPVTDIAAKGHKSLVLTTSGRVLMFGDAELRNLFYHPTHIHVIPKGDPIVSVASTENRAYAVSEVGNIYRWGSNDVNLDADAATLEPFHAIKGVIRLYAGCNHQAVRRRGMIGRWRWSRWRWREAKSAKWTRTGLRTRLTYLSSSSLVFFSRPPLPPGHLRQRTWLDAGDDHAREVHHSRQRDLQGERAQGTGRSDCPSLAGAHRANIDNLFLLVIVVLPSTLTFIPLVLPHVLFLPRFLPLPLPLPLPLAILLRLLITNEFLDELEGGVSAEAPSREGDGFVYTYGKGVDGRLGHGLTYSLSQASKLRPCRVEKLSKMTIAKVGGGGVGGVICGKDSTGAITDTGKLYTWGNQQFGKTGHGSSRGEKSQLHSPSCLPESSSFATPSFFSPPPPPLPLMLHGCRLCGRPSSRRKSSQADDRQVFHGQEPHALSERRQPFLLLGLKHLRPARHPQCHQLPARAPRDLDAPREEC